MITTIKLYEKDIEKIIAEKYNTDIKNVGIMNVCLFTEKNDISNPKISYIITAGVKISEDKEKSNDKRP